MVHERERERERERSKERGTERDIDLMRGKKRPGVIRRECDRSDRERKRAKRFLDC